MYRRYFREGPRAARSFVIFRSKYNRLLCFFVGQRTGEGDPPLYIDGNSNNKTLIQCHINVGPQLTRLSMLNAGPGGKWVYIKSKINI